MHEVLFADFTFEYFFPCVGSLVTFDMRLLGKTFLAESTFKWFFSAVFCLVSGKMVLPFKSFFADPTFVWSLSCMHPLVSGEVPWRGEVLSTNFTFKMFFLRCGFYGDLQDSLMW